ncbi:MBL fold metallo-hydrolase [Paremcibacter congregatus]|uniref:MBL fold metallo-hydrolase n=1 Tax=Paremcibacter congregatus TaxID=2043170 RepID=UPI0030ED5694
MLKAKIIPVTPFQQNCTLLWCDETMKGAVVDAGGEVDVILDAIKAQGVEVEKILITHGHLDHAGGAAELAERLHIPIIGPQKEDKFWIDQIPDNCRTYGIPVGRSFNPDQWLEGGDQVMVGNVTLDVYYCPGHTPGHVIFHNKEAKFAQVGDVLFHGSIGRTDFPRGDHATLLKSIREQLWPLGDDTTFVSGHGPVSTFGQERATNPFVRDEA